MSIKDYFLLPDHKILEESKLELEKKTKELFCVMDGGRCSFRQKNNGTGCSFCSLNQLNDKSRTPDFWESIISLDHVNELVNEYQPESLVLSVNGSIFGPEFNQEALFVGLKKILENPCLQEIIFETRMEWLNEDLLVSLSNSIPESIKIGFNVGLEIFDNDARKATSKQVKLKDIERTYFLIDKLLANRGLLTFYMLFKPFPHKMRCFEDGFPTWDITRSENDILQALEYLISLGSSKSEISIWINFTFPSRGTIIEDWWNNGVWTPPSKEEVCELFRKIKLFNLDKIKVRPGIAKETLPCSERSGVYKEGLVESEGDDFIGKEEYEMLYNFILTQDYSCFF